MNWERLKARLIPKRERRTGGFLLPPVVVDLQPGFVVGARLDKSTRQVRRVAVRELEAGALEALPSRSNLAKQEVVRQAIRGVLETVGDGGGRLGILVPDASVRVAILHFETLPDNRAEADSLVRWKMGGILPFPAEEARVSYQVLFKGEQSVELLAMGMRSSVVTEYETEFGTLSFTPALVLPATAALLPLLPAGSAASQVLVHVCSGSVTTVVVVGDSISFWRNRVIEEHTAEGEGEVVREVARVVAASRDHLKSEIESLYIYVRPPASSSLDNEIRAVTGAAVQLLPSAASHATTLPPPEQKLLGEFGMTLAGLLENRN